MPAPTVDLAEQRACDFHDATLTLKEWQTCELRGPSDVLTPGDRKLVDALARSEGGKLIITELRSGLRVEARSWVGVVQFENFTLRVLPKLAGENLGLVRLIQFSSGLDSLRRIPGRRVLEVQGDNLIDLLALLFVHACEDIARAGLLKDYVEREEDLPVVRGRVLGARQILKRFGQVDRLACRFDEHEHDVVENQLLAAALRAAAPRIREESLRHRAHRMYGIFSEVCDPDVLDLSSVRRGLQYQRQNQHYRHAHQLAWLILDALGVEDVLAPGEVGSFAFLIDMDHLFETFVARLIERLLVNTGDRVRPQHRDRSIIWNEDAGRPYSTVIPDVLIERRNKGRLTRIPVDAKYKLYDERRVSPGDIYQSFLYAYAYGTTGGRAGVIVHPSSTGATTTRRLSVRGADGLVASNLFVLSLPIPKALDELETGGMGPTLNAIVDVLQVALEREISARIVA